MVHKSTNTRLSVQYRDEAIGIKWWTLIGIYVTFSLYKRVWQMAINILQFESQELQALWTGMIGNVRNRMRCSVNTGWYHNLELQYLRTDFLHNE